MRAFRQAIDNQIVTVFGLRRAPLVAAGGGHYGVASAGDAAVRLGVTLTHALSNVRGRLTTRWSTPMDSAPSRELAALHARRGAAVLRRPTSGCTT